MKTEELLAQLQASNDRDSIWLQADAQANPERMRRLSRFNGVEPSLEAFWKREIAYWREVRRDAQLNNDPEQLARAAKSLRTCIKHLGGLKRGH